MQLKVLTKIKLHFMNIHSYLRNANKIEDLNSREFKKISDDLESKIKKGKLIEQNWHCNQFPGSWIYEVGERVIQLRIIEKTGFSMEAMFV